MTITRGRSIPSGLGLARSGIVTDPTFQVFGLAGVLARVGVWEGRFRQAMIDGMREWADKVETEMQQNARWQDQTRRARQALRAYLQGDNPRVPSWATASPPVVPVAKGDYVVVVTGLMHYNQFLETKWNGRYAIMWPTVVQNNASFVKILVRHGAAVS